MPATPTPRSARGSRARSLGAALALADPKFNDRVRLLWLATGKEDFVMPSTKAMLALFDRSGIRYTYKETEGGHTWPNWRAYLSEFAPLLFR